jgi:hypothetical protein
MILLPRTNKLNRTKDPSFRKDLLSQVSPMNNPVPHVKKPIRWILVAVLGMLLLSAAARSGAPAPMQAEQGVSSSPEEALRAAWERARGAGSYDFAIDLTQRAIPRATVANVGLTSKDSRYYLEGTSSLPDESLEITMWGRGGSALLGDTGLQIRTIGNQAWARRGEGEWTEIRNFTGGYAPNGDFLAIVAAAENVRMETRELPEPTGGTFTVFTFDVSGASYAEQMRIQMEKELRAAGQLPAGVHLETANTYADMIGSGELWVSPDGLPARQELHLRFPENEDGHIEALLTANFSAYGEAATDGRNANGWIDFDQVDWPGLAAAAQNIFNDPLPALILGSLLLAGVAVVFSRRRRALLYRIIVFAYLAAVIVSPFAGSRNATAYAAEREQQAALETEAEEAEAREEAFKTFLDATPGHDWPANTDPVKAARDSAVQEAQARTLASDLGISIPAAQDDDPNLIYVTIDDQGRPLFNIPDNGADADGDGLTDTEETLLGTSSSTNDDDEDGVADGQDTDRDLINDRLEVEGFSYNGQDWYLDPREMDTNGDTLPDTLECTVSGGTLDCPDTDGDGTPDAFDDDNDGDGIPDELDLSPFKKYSTLFTQNAPLELTVDGLEEGTITYVEFQMQPDNPDHLWYAFNVLDWPEDTLGQIQEHESGADAATFYSLCVEGLDPGVNAADACDMARDSNGDVKFVPMLEIVLPDDSHVPDEETLEKYGILVQPISSSGSEQVAYMPLTLITDPNGERHVAFYGKMVYEIGSDSWGGAHEVRMVWAVQMLVDNVCTEDDGNGNCLVYADNVLQIIHSYYDDWRLAGLNVREDYGTDIAMIYEDPNAEPSDEWDNDGELIALADSLDYTFLIPRDCDAVTGQGECISDGERDIGVDEIYARFNHASNNGVDETARWGLDDIFTVQTFSYDHLDAALFAMAEDENPAVLDSVFTPLWTPSNQLSPSLLFAREDHYRALNINVDGMDDSIDKSGRSIGIDFDAGGGNPVQVLNALTIAPFQYDDETGSWSSYPMDEYLEVLADRYALEAVAEDEDPLIREGLVLASQLYYLSLNHGLSSITGTTNSDVSAFAFYEPSITLSDEELKETISSWGGAGAKATVFVVNVKVFSDLAGKKLMLEYLGELSVEMFDAPLQTLRDATIDDTLHSVSNKLKNIFSSSASIKDRGVGVIAAVTIAFFIIGAVLLLANVPHAVQIAGATLLTVASVIAFAAAPALSILSAITAFKAVGASGGNIVSSVLKGSAELVGQTRAAAVVGLALQIVIVWTVFAVLVGTGGYKPGSIEFNTILAFTLAGTILTIIFFILSLTAVGFVIVSILGVIDLIATLFCLANDKDECFSISGAITEFLADLLYTADSTIDLEIEGTDGEPLLLNWYNFYQTLTDESVGMQEGNSLTFSASINTNIFHKVPEDSGAISTNFYSASELKRSTFVHSLEDNDATPPDETSLGIQSSWWTSVAWDADPSTPNQADPTRFTILTPAPVYIDLQLYYAYRSEDLTSSPYTLSRGINEQVPLYYHLSYAVPGYDCWVGVCDSLTIKGASITDLSDELIFDVFPDSLDAFYAWNWDSLLTQLYNAQPYYALDHDGDGLITNLLPDGNDPNDSLTGCGGGLCWDTDGDGLSDGYEMAYREAGYENGGGNIDLLSPDTDGDGLLDAEETKLGSNPADSDTDGDGLTDKQEVDGWLFEYGSGTHILVTSDPRLADTDGDGLSDALEKTLHESDPAFFQYHPRVENPNPLELIAETDMPQGIYLPGATVAYTLTIKNSFDTDAYIDGSAGLSAAPLTNNGSSSTNFNLFTGKSKTLVTTFSIPGGAGSQETDITAEAEGELTDAQGQAIPGVLTPDLETIITIDADEPTSTLTTSPFVMSGGVRIIGGSAGDPTSYVTAVEVKVGSGPWELAEGADQWAYALSVPNTSGSLSILVRAYDAAGNVQSNPTQVTIQVDDDPPAVDAAGVFLGNPFITAVRNSDDIWSVPLYGTASDAAAGVAAVEIRLDPNGFGWQPADYDENAGTWSIDYALSNFTSSNAPIFEATGQYTVYMRGIDRALDTGNVFSDTVTIRLDNTAPIVMLDPVGGDSPPPEYDAEAPPDTLTIDDSPISSELTLTGSVTDSGEVGIGVAGMEIAFMPIEAVQAISSQDAHFLLDEPPGAEVFSNFADPNNDGICAAGQCPSTGAPGRFGTAALFNGALSQYIDVPNLDVNETGYTAALWFKTNCDDCGLFSADDGVLGNLGSDRELYLVGGNVCSYVDGAGTDICSAGVNYADGAWHMIVDVIGADGHQLFVDGEPAAEDNITASSLAAQDGVNIGFATRAGQPFLTGYLDEVQVLGQAIDAKTVRSLYQSWIAFDPDNPGAVSSTWSYDIPYGLEGLYQIDLLATDLLFNRNDDRITWNKWRGEIDTLEPRILIELEYTGSGSTARTKYTISVEDANLSLARFATPCTIQPGDKIFGSDGRLIGLDISCLVDGWETAPTFARACDTLGQCAAAYPEQVYLYMSTDSGISRIPMAGDSTTDEMFQGIVDGSRAHGIVLDVENGHVYWAEFGSGTDTGRVRRADLDGNNIIDIITGIPSPEMDNSITTRPVLHIGLAIDLDANKLYWTETETGLVKRANLDGSGAETLVDVWAALGAQPLLGHITLDPVNNRLYWAQGRNDSPFAEEIWGSDTDGNDFKDIIDSGRFIDGIAADPVNGKIYWNETNDDEDGVVWMADLDGSSAVELVIGHREAGENEFHALALTPDSQTLIFNAGPYTEQLPGSGNTFIYIMPHLRSVQVDGSQHDYLFPTYTPITSCLESACPIATAAVGGGSQNGLTVGLLPNTSITTTDLELTFTTNTDVALPDATLFYTFTVENKGPLDAYDTVMSFDIPADTSVADNAGCSPSGGVLVCELGNLLEGGSQTLAIELTVDSNPTGRLEGSAVVSTGTGDHLSPNNTVETRAYSAQPRPEPVSGSTLTLYIADRTTLGGTDTDIIDEDNNVLVDSADAGEVGDLVVDETRGKIYWSDRSNGRIMRADLDGANPEVLLSGLDFPRGLAMSPDETFLYIGDNDRISRLNLNNLNWVTLLEGSTDPDDLEYDPIRDHLFWRSSNSIYKMDLLEDDGPVEVLVGLSQVSTMVIDPYRGLIYWNKNNYYGEIWQAGMDGTNVKLVDEPGRTPDKFWYDLLGDDIYYFEYISFSTINEYFLSNEQLTSGGGIIGSGFVFPRAITGRYILPPPEAPTITSSPGTEAITGQPYSYQPSASGDAPITWALISPPSEMTIDIGTGLVEWIPGSSGTYGIEIEATNNTGSDIQAYNLEVINPDAPTIFSLPVLQVEFGQDYSYQAEGTATGGIAWSLGTAPAGMTIGANGLVEWTPGAAGLYDVEVEATNLGGTTVQSYQVNVYAFDATDQLYWVIDATVPDQIRRADLGILDANIMLTGTVERTYQITIDQLHGVFYYVDGDGAFVSGSPFEIWSSDMDGGSAVMLIDELDPNLESVYGIAVDPINGHLYWTDPVAGQIGRSDLDGANSAIMLTGLTLPKALEIDISAGRLYWIDHDGLSDVLLSANVDGSDLQTVASLDQTRHFVLDPEEGWIFYHTGGANSVVIHKADYTPTGLSNISDLYTGIVQVSGLYLDHDTQELYWTVHNNDEIWTGFISGADDSQLLITNLGSGPADIHGRHAYWQDLAGPELTIDSVADNDILIGYDPVMITGTITATASLESLTVRQLIGGSWTVVHTETWMEGEAYTANWAYEWTDPTAGFSAVGTYEFQVEVIDWGNRNDEITDLTLEVQPPPSNFTLPPDLAPLHVEVTSPANGAIFTGFDPITITFGAAAEQYLLNVTMYEHTYLDDNITFDGFDWGEAVEFEGSVVWTPPVWPETREYVFTLTGEDWDFLSEVITFTLTIVVPPGDDTEPVGHDGPVLDAVIDAPLDGALITSLDPVTVEGSAYAADDLATLEVTVDGSPIYSDSWADGDTTDETWSTSWSPASDGVFVLEAVVTDWAGRTLTETHPVTVTVDTAAPAVSIDQSLFTQADQTSSTSVLLTGTLSASPGSEVEINIDGAGWIPVPVIGANWSYEWFVNADGTVFNVEARVTDAAGREGSDTQAVTVDTVAPAPVDIHLYAAGVEIQAGDTVYAESETLTIEWAAGSDGSGLGDYLAGWQTTAAPDIGVLTPVAGLQHSENVLERTKTYAHLVVQDIHGNRTVQTIGVIYVDAPEAYDLVEELDYHGYERSGATQIGASSAISETAPSGTTPNGLQRFYMSWDADDLRFAWDGANWAGDGDLFIYLDTAPGGADTLFNPYGDGVEIRFPGENGDAFEADFVLMLEDGGNAGLYEWDGDAWVQVQVLTADDFKLLNKHTDLLLPFSWLGLDPSQPLKLLAVAGEEDALAIWAAMPDKNPLNSAKVINPLADDQQLTSFALTQYYSWSNLDNGMLPNDGQFSAGDLALSIASNRPAVAAGFLADGLFGLLTPDSRLDADLDGVLDIALPYAQDPDPLGNGAVVEYTVTYENAGTDTVPNVVLNLSAYGAVQLVGGTQVVIGDVPAGASGSVAVQAVINSAADAESGELVFELSDGPHGAYDWFWFQHDVDADAPLGVTIVQPGGYAQPGTRTISGAVSDGSSIDHVDLEVRTQPGGAVDAVVCPDGDTDGAWNCQYDFGDLVGLDSVEIRARAVDAWGGASAWTDWVFLVVDLSAPSLTLDASVDDALADGYMGPGEFFIHGTVADNEKIHTVELCLEDTDVVCFNSLVTPPDGTAGSWGIDVAAWQNGDGVTQTLTLVGEDKAGNTSEPISRTYKVDVVAPVIEVETFTIQAADGGEESTPSVLNVEMSGTVTDGGEVDEVRVRVSYNGQVSWYNAVVSGDSWTFVRSFVGPGSYLFTAEAYDVAGNLGAGETYPALLEGLVLHYLPVVIRSDVPAAPAAEQAPAAGSAPEAADPVGSSAAGSFVKEEIQTPRFDGPDAGTLIR